MPGRRDALQGGGRGIAFTPSGTSSPAGIGLARSAPGRGPWGELALPPGRRAQQASAFARSAPGRGSVGRACPPPRTSGPRGGHRLGAKRRPGRGVTCSRGPWGELALPPGRQPTGIGLARSAPGRGPGGGLALSPGMILASGRGGPWGELALPPGRQPTGIGLARSAPRRGPWGELALPPGN